MKNNFSKILGEKRLSITKISKGTGVSRTTLTSIYYDRAEGIKLETLEKLCRYLNCKIDNIFEID